MKKFFANKIVINIIAILALIIILSVVVILTTYTIVILEHCTGVDAGWICLIIIVASLIRDELKNKTKTFDK